MQNLIEAVLQYAQTEGEFLDYQNTDLNILASQAVESLSEAIQLKKASVVIGNFHTFSVFPVTMEQVFVKSYLAMPLAIFEKHGLSRRLSKFRPGESNQKILT